MRLLSGTRSRSWAWALAVTAVALCALTAVTPAHARRHHKSCGTIHSPFTHNHRERVVVLRSVQCTIARRVARGFDRKPLGGARQPYGYVCFNGHLPQRYLFVCAKGARGHGGVQRWRHVLEAFPT